MKKAILSQIPLLTLALCAYGAVVLDEPFNYADGSLVFVTTNWITHSATSTQTGQVDVASGKVNLTQLEGEDVSRFLAGEPYTNGFLYASFVVNFSVLPAGTGGYFAHLKDEGAMNFRARVFASTTGAGSGKFRVGIANSSGTPVSIASDLSLNTDYLLVVRYDTATASSTVLWINPSSEISSVNRAVATDSTTPILIRTFALRQSTSSGNGMGVLALDNLKVGTQFGDVATPSGPPSISAIGDQRISANGTTGPLAFTVDDAETSVSDLVVSGTSSNPTLVPDTSIVFGGSGANRTVTVTAAPDQQGATTITIIVTDSDGLTATNMFGVTVGAPTISSIADQITPVSTPLSGIAFTISDTESPADNLSLAGSSSSQGLLPDGNITFTGSGSSRTATLTPTPGLSGIATVTISVSDGINTAATSFTLTVYPPLGIQLADDFNSYTNGPLFGNMDNFLWSHHSPSGAGFFETLITDQKVQLSFLLSEDLNAPLANGTFGPNSGVVLFSGFTVNFSQLPSQPGTYFAHYKDEGTVNFRCRVWASTTNAAPGKYRLGIGNSSGATALSGQIPVDLEPNQTYCVVTRYNVGTGSSTIWLNPFGESDPSTTAIDTPQPVGVTAFALRQNSGIGVLTMDDLKVSSSFGEVLPIKLQAALLPDGKVQIAWSTNAASNAQLQCNAGFDPSGWANVTLASSIQGNKKVVEVSAPEGAKFFRLIRVTP